MNKFENKEIFKEYYLDRFAETYRVTFDDSSLEEKFRVLAAMVMDVANKNWKETKSKTKNGQVKEVIYFSSEFLMGRMITNNLMNLNIRKVVEEGLKDLGVDINELEHAEADAGLGNGGLGRLAACFLDSTASMALPVHGNCIRYNYGFFEQVFEHGYQIEKPDTWIKGNYPWEVRLDSEAVTVHMYGRLQGDRVVDAIAIKAVHYVMPIIGDRNGIVNTLKLWSAEPIDGIQKGVDQFEYNTEVRSITDQLYPDDSTYEGKMLRLKQQYFFSSAGVQSAIDKYLNEQNGNIRNLNNKYVFHINDTHPTLVIPELMRILLDEHHLPWDEAWEITRNTCAYTNHTILAEALEKWPAEMIKKLIPRIYQIIEEINRRYCEKLNAKFTGNPYKVADLSIIGYDQVRMAHLAIAGSFSVNGVAALHTEILKTVEMKDFHELYPDKFNNKTNGITHRRWLLHSNPELVEILNEYVEGDWIKDYSKIEIIAEKANDEILQKKFDNMKQTRKNVLADIIEKDTGVKINRNSIFDIQVKRLHEYKRQLMNALHIMHVYNQLKTNPEFKANYYPHTFIFGAKAAPSYAFAKKIMKLINTIGDKVNNDPEIGDLLKVVFVTNYNVTYAEYIMPAADISEQISTASKEASGTGNMKFMANGAVTIGTMDGANVEIAELVGEENIVIFGLTAEQVNSIYAAGNNNPVEHYQGNDYLKIVIDQLTNGFFETVPSDEFVWISHELLAKDSYLILNDFESYRIAHEKCNELYKDRCKWLSMSIINTAKSTYFTTDRTMADYNRDIWHLKPYN